jgi:hypothetical protein
MPTSHGDTSLISRINSLLGEVGGNTKSASEMGMSGQGTKDPGGYSGPSTHPSARNATHTEPAPLGSRAKENESDVKEDHPGGGVDNVSPNSGGTQDDKQYSIGTKQTATGEDPSVEDNYKGTKEDPGTTHPANAEEVGDKYASMQIRPLLKLAFDKMNGVLADIANGNHIAYYNGVIQKQAAAQNPQAPRQTLPAPNGTANGAATLAATAGYELADHAIKQAAAEKEAAQKVVARLIREAEEDADFVGDYHTKYAKHRGGQFKRAMDPAAATDGEDHAMAGGMPPGMEGGMPPGMGGGAPPEGGLPPEMGGGAPPPSPRACRSCRWAGSQAGHPRTCRRSH